MNKTHKGTVLIIEDEAGFQLIYRGVLENEGYEVLGAQSGEKGLELAIEKKPDIILLDLILPGLSGYEVLEKIRTNKITKDIPVIVFSIMGEHEKIKKALELGANYYRVKGINSPKEILGQIQAILEKSPSK